MTPWPFILKGQNNCLLYPSMLPLLALSGCNHYASKIGPNQKNVMFILTNVVVMGIVIITNASAILDGVKGLIVVKVSQCNFFLFFQKLFWSYFDMRIFTYSRKSCFNTFIGFVILFMIFTFFEDLYIYRWYLVSPVKHWILNLQDCNLLGT